MASSQKPVQERLREADPGPRAKMAARIYASGQVTSMAEASRLAGLSSQYLGQLLAAQNPKIMEIVSRVDKMIEDEAVDMSSVIRMLGRRAVRNIAYHMEQGADERLRFKAAQDLADRSPETSKTQKIAVDNMTMTDDGAREIASAMVEAARIRERHALESVGDVVRVDTDRAVGALPERSQSDE